MSKLYNSFRPNKYYRSKFQEGKYLLAQEASDLQLESFGQLRDYIKQTYGDVCVGNAFKVEGSGVILTVRPGEAWVDGLPFLMKSGTDTLVNGGTLPAGTSVADLSASGSDLVGGKTITLTGGGTTPAETYSVVIEATEELVEGSGAPSTGLAIDPYLIGSSLTEQTEIKSRLIYKIHVVKTSDLTSTPTYPLANNSITSHFVNEISITPGAPNSDLNIITGGGPTTTTIDSDGANCSVTFINISKKIPYSGDDIAEYIFGKLIDSDGNVFTILSSSVGTNTITLFINREPDIASNIAKATIPVITQGVPFKMVKRDHYVVHASTGLFLGKKYLKVATFGFTTAVTTVTDNRTIVEYRSHNHDGTKGESSALTPASVTASGAISGTTITGTTITGTSVVSSGPVSGTTITGSGAVSGSTVTASGAISFGSIATTPANLVGSAMTSTGANAVVASCTTGVLAKAWGNIQANGTINNSFRISSVGVSGNYTVYFSTPMNNTTYSVVVTPTDNSFKGVFSTYVYATDRFVVYFYNLSGNVTACSFSFAVFGN
jgi:hypothetical protein